MQKPSSRQRIVALTTSRGASKPAYRRCARTRRNMLCRNIADRRWGCYQKLIYSHATRITNLQLDIMWLIGKTLTSAWPHATCR